MATYSLSSRCNNSPRLRKWQRQIRSRNISHGPRLVRLRTTHYSNHRFAGHDSEHHCSRSLDRQRLRNDHIIQIEKKKRFSGEIVIGAERTWLSSLPVGSIIYLFYWRCISSLLLRTNTLAYSALVSVVAYETMGFCENTDRSSIEHGGMIRKDDSKPKRMY